MKPARALVLALALHVPAACGDDGGDTGRQTDSASTSTTSTSTSTTEGTSTSTTQGTSTQGGTDSATSAPTTGAPTSTDSATSDPGSTSATTDTTGTSDASTGTTGPVSGSSSGSSTTGPDCVPAAEVCNDIDDDCNGITDDVDVGGDGICDCLSIALFGNKGANPAAQFEAWLEAQGTTVDRIQTANMPIDQATLDKYDIIILDRLIRAYNPQEAALIEGWVSAGGGLMSMTGYTGGPSDVDFPNSITGPMGLTYNNGMGIISGPVVNWVAHPISAMINSVTFLGGFYINVMNDGIGTNTVVATLAPGPVAVAQVRNDGKVFLWGDEWIEFDSEWQNMPEIKQLWANILGWLSPQNFCTIPQ